MYSRRISFVVRSTVIVGVLVSTGSSLGAQVPGEPQHQHDQPTPSGQDHSQHDMQHMQMSEGDGGMPPARDASGTSWLPDETPMYAIHRQAGSWMLMAHGNAFLQYLHDSGDRGSHQGGSINWFMGMGARDVGDGHLQLRAMVSLEPWTIAGCGYPDLLASGEVCEGQPIHDRQHPHDLFMELAATYDRPLGGDVRLQLYGGPVGEPALGPPAYPHRISAMPNPLAPITHHWLDATHIAFGVATAGVYGKRWKAEASVFNGREPDEHRTDFDFGALDSWSGRVWFLPTSRWALQASAGHLTEAEAGQDGGARIDVDRVTASATYHRRTGPVGIWATTLGWGHNREVGIRATNAFLAETSLTLDAHNTWFGRFELSDKSGHDLGIESPDLFSIAKLQGGHAWYFQAWRGWQPGVGGALSIGFVPGSLERFYGSRANLGFGLFLTLRPAEQRMH